MIAHVKKRLNEAEEELAKTEKELEGCWSINEFEYLKEKKKRLEAVIATNIGIYMKASVAIPERPIVATKRITKIRGYDK